LPQVQHLFRVYLPAGFKIGQSHDLRVDIADGFFRLRSNVNRLGLQLSYSSLLRGDLVLELDDKYFLFFFPYLMLFLDLKF
jgi:hypothetical protein